MASNMSANGYSSPPLPVFYADFDSPLSTKKERKRAMVRSVPRVVRTAPAVSRVYPRRFLIQKQHFITFKGNSDPVLNKSKSYNERCGLTYFEQCFEQERKIGEGSFGEVFRAKSKDDNKWYAVKRTIEPFRNSSDRELKLREVQKHELLPKHPNLVEFIRAWEERGRLFIQTELCEYSLSDYCEREHNIPEEQLWFYFADLVAAVYHLHSHDLLHLDIKPENIFVSRDQVCKLGDFGLIFDLNHDTLVTAQDGDSKYLAPEVLNSSPGQAADIFSLGISILELATDLDLPSRGEGWHMLREGKIPESFTNRVSPKLRHLVYWMMEPEPVKRPTAQQLLNDVTIQHYLALRLKQRPGQLTKSVIETVLWLCICLLNAIQFILWPITKTISCVVQGTSVTPGHQPDSPRRTIFYGSATPESPSRHTLPHSARVVQRLRFDNCDSDDEENRHTLYDVAGLRSCSVESDPFVGFDHPHRRLFVSQDNCSSTNSSAASSPTTTLRSPTPDKLPDAKDKYTSLTESPRRSPARRIPIRPISPVEDSDESGDEMNPIKTRLHEHSSRRLLFNTRSAMSAPVPRQMRAQLRTTAIRPLSKHDFSMLDSPKHNNTKRNAARPVDSRDSSADEMAM